MTELVQKVRQQATLEAQQMDLLQEKKQLEKEVFDLKISVHNKQAAAEDMERFHLGKLLMKLTGTYEEKLAEAHRDVRTVKAQHSFSAARLENINLQLAQIPQDIAQLQGCAHRLSAVLQEKLGENPCAEEETQVKALEAAVKSGTALEEAGKTLNEALDTALAWMGTRPGMYAAIAEMRRAETRAQEQLNHYVDQLNALQQQLAPLGYYLKAEEMKKFGRDYLMGLLTGFMPSNRYLNVQQQLVQINRQWNTLFPQLNHRLRTVRIDWMEALCGAANT